MKLIYVSLSFDWWYHKISWGGRTCKQSYDSFEDHMIQVQSVLGISFVLKWIKCQQASCDHNCAIPARAKTTELAMACCKTSESARFSGLLWFTIVAKHKKENQKNLQNVSLWVVGHKRLKCRLIPLNRWGCFIWMAVSNLVFLCKKNVCLTNPSNAKDRLFFRWYLSYGRCWLFYFDSCQVHPVRWDGIGQVGAQEWLNRAPSLSDMFRTMKAHGL